MESKKITIERWDCLELAFQGKSLPNPFVDATIRAVFSGLQESVSVEGFYDGGGVYKVRFMPAFCGTYTYEAEGTFSDVKYTGEFEVTEAAGNNHGPVKVSDRYHFTYMDGNPYYPAGTTCYAWVHQPEAMQETTLHTLAQSPFNKIRFCIFPKHYDYNLYEPISYPYEGTPCRIDGINRDNFMEFKPDNQDNHWDFARFNPEHFQIIERRIRDLKELGIEADIILMHPYDRWGFSQMGRENDLRYIRYVIARFSAFRNVWWSLANEYDLCEGKSAQDWEQIAETIVRYDPYQHLRSIHNCHYIYDLTRPWVTHCSIQRTEIYLSAVNTKLWRMQYGKPVVLDEVGYEGDINYDWGNLTAQEMVRLFWTTTVRGGYCGHGETYVREDNKLWWSHGNALYGESPVRIAFLYRVLSEVPGLGLEPADWPRWNDNVATAAHPKYKGKYFLCYTGNGRPSFREFSFPAGKQYRVEVIDTWDMTIEDRGIYSGKFYIDLPAKQYIALRIREIEN
jgi:hypothetical protein